MEIFQSSGWNNANKRVCQPLDATAFDLDAAASSSRVAANAAASILDAGACYVPNTKTHFSWILLHQTFPTSPTIINLVNIKEKCQYIV